MLAANEVDFPFDGMVELHPGLASVAQDIPAIAHLAVSLALAAISRPAVKHSVVPVKLIEGATLGPAPAPTSAIASFAPGAHP